MKKLYEIWYEIWMDFIEPDDRVFGATPFDVAAIAAIILAIMVIAR